MAEPKTEIERRLDRIEKAIDVTLSWITAVDSNFRPEGAQEIRDILYGRTETASEGRAEATS